jgi:superfamily II DNA or RNA helicase
MAELLEYACLQHQIGEQLLRTQPIYPRPLLIDGKNKAVRPFQKQVLQRTFFFGILFYTNVFSQALDFLIVREVYGISKFVPFVMTNVHGGALCAPTGTGKTFILIQVCAERRLEKPEYAKKAASLHKTYAPLNLIVCPSAIKSHWMNEIRTALPTASIFEFQRDAVKKDDVTFICHFELRKNDDDAHLVGAYDISYVSSIANAFVLLSWECLSQEFNYARAADGRDTRSQHSTGADVFSLGRYCFGRIVFDEGQMAGTESSSKFEMCTSKLTSIFRFYQSASPVNAKHSVIANLKRICHFLGLYPNPNIWTNEAEIVRLMSGILWCHTRDQVQSQLQIPAIVHQIVPIRFSVLEREYYDIAKLDASARHRFCKQIKYDRAKLTLTLIEHQRLEIHALEESKALSLHERGLRLYFSEHNTEEAISALSAAIAVATNAMCIALPKQVQDVLNMREEPNWNHHLDQFVTTLLFVQAHSCIFKCPNDWYEQMRNENEAVYLQNSNEHRSVCEAQDDIRTNYIEYRNLYEGMNTEARDICEKMFEIWLDYTQLVATNFVEIFDEFRSNEKEPVEMKFGGAYENMLWNEYNNLHARLNACLLFHSKAKNSSKNETTLHRTLHYKLWHTAKTLQRRFVAQHALRGQLQALEEFCVMVKYYRPVKTAQTKRLIQNHVQKFHGGNWDKQRKMWKRFAQKEPKLLPENVTPQNCKLRLIAENKRFNDASNASCCMRVIENLRMQCAKVTEDGPRQCFQRKRIEWSKKLRRLASTSRIHVFDPPCFPFSLESEQCLERKLRYMAEVLPQLLNVPEMHCMKCNNRFDRTSGPIVFVGCGHTICEKCEIERCEACSQKNLHSPDTACVLVAADAFAECKCFKCGSYRGHKNGQIWSCGLQMCEMCVVDKTAVCPYCKKASKREVPDLPSGLLFSNTYVDTSVKEDYEASYIHNAETAISVRERFRKIKRVPHKPGAKIQRIVELVQSLVQKDPTTKILAFDVDMEFLKELAIYLKSNVAELTVLHLKRTSNCANADEDLVLSRFRSCLLPAVLCLDLLNSAGLHLVVANTVILCSPHEDPSVELQAEERAHRFGQTRIVSVYRCYVENSVEFDVFQRSQARMNSIVEKNKQEEGRCLRDETKCEEEEKVQEQESDEQEQQTNSQEHRESEQDADPNYILDEHVSCTETWQDFEMGNEKLVASPAVDESLIPETQTEDLVVESPCGATRNDDDKIESVLYKLQMAEYISNFHAEKYELLSDLDDLMESDLDRLKIPWGVRTRLFRVLKNVRGVKRQRTC